MSKITQELVQEYFDYHPDGYLVWKKRSSNRAVVGRRYGPGINKLGYVDGQLKGKRFLEHQLIFLYHHGYIPKMIDHINGVTMDNRIQNLRECTNSQNQRNRGPDSGTTSGFKGVWKTQRGKWLARVTHEGKRYHCGIYASKEEAAKAYDKKAKELHGPFARLNFPQ